MKNTTLPKTSLGYMMRLNLSVAIVDMILIKPQNYSLPSGYDDTTENYFYVSVLNKINGDSETTSDNLCPYENGTEIVAVKLSI